MMNNPSANMTRRCAASRLLILALLIAAEACSAFSTRPPTRSRSSLKKPGTISRRVFAFTATGSLHATFSPNRKRQASPSTKAKTEPSTSTSLDFQSGADDSPLDFDSSILDTQWRSALEDLEEMNGGAPAGATPGPLIQKADVEYNLRDTASGVGAVGKGALDVAAAFVPVLIEVGVVVTIASHLQ